eukprot:4879945-Amphidinium_carterae.1
MSQAEVLDDVESVPEEMLKMEMALEREISALRNLQAELASLQVGELAADDLSSSQLGEILVSEPSSS